MPSKAVGTAQVATWGGRAATRRPAGGEEITFLRCVIGLWTWGRAPAVLFEKRLQPQRVSGVGQFSAIDPVVDPLRRDFQPLSEAPLLAVRGLSRPGPQLGEQLVEFRRFRH